MANKDDYLTQYRQFFQEFANTVEPNDQLPVKLGSYKFINSEVVGGIVDWCLQYLNRKSCPSSLVSSLIQTTIVEIRIACKKSPLSCGFNPTENVYEPLKLMQTVMSKLNEICFRYLDNSQLDNLPLPPTLSIPSVSVCSTRNTRRRMEDRHVVIHDINTMFNIQDSSQSSYYAVFDGHAGSDAASYSAAHLHQFLVESKFYPSDPERALKEAFIRTDDLFLEKSKIENFRSGTTAVCALLRPKEEILYVAWVGDSQALLVNRGKVLQIVEPHKPSREDEKERIEAHGGCVMFWGMWRVNGQLAVSRAIGDIKMKPYVTAEPDIVTVPLDGNEEFLIIACDGFWDFVSEDDAAIAVYNIIKENSANFESVAEQLVELAKQKGSRDNISIIVIFLKDPSKTAKKLSSNWSWTAKSGTGMDVNSDNSNNATNDAFDVFDVFQMRTTILDHTNNLQQNLLDDNRLETDKYIEDRKQIGKRPADRDVDEDFGPETNLDNIDDIILPTAISTNNNSPDVDFEILHQNSNEFGPVKTNAEINEIFPADSVLDTSCLVDNVADSGDDSEDEWNYYRVDPKLIDNLPPAGTDKTVLKNHSSSDSEEMSQLNPDAKEFVPVSPTRSTASPSYNRDVMDDTLISQSPRRAVAMDINVPSPVEFQCEVKQRPSEVFDESNQKMDDDENRHDLSSQEIMQKLLNGKDVSEIEFRPMNCEKTSGTEQEPDIANNETNPFELKSDLDSSESNDVINLSQCDFLLKKQDPMSISFYEDQNEKGTEFSTNPFDPNKVQWLPDEMDVEDKEDTYNINKALSESETQLKNVATESKVFSINQDKNGVIDISEIAESMQNKMSISPELLETNRISYTNENECKLYSGELANGVYVIENSSIENLSDKFTDSNMFVDVSETFKSPIVDIQSMEQFSPAGPLSPKSPIPELTGLVSPDITASIKDENISGDISESRSPMLNQRSAAGSPFNDILKSPIQELKNELPHGKSSTNISVDIERILSPEITNSPISSLDQPLECHQALNVEAGLSERSISPETLEDGKNIEPLMEFVIDKAVTPINVVDPNSINEIEKIESGILDSTLDDQMSETTNIIDTTLQLKINTGENLSDLIDGTCETLLEPIVTEKNENPSQIEHATVENASNILEINTNTELSDSNKIFENDEQVSENNENIVLDADINGEIFSDVNEVTSEEQIFKPKGNESERNTLEENHIQSEVDASANINTSVVESCVSQSDVNSFLDRSVLPDVTSPLSPSEKPDQFQHDHPELWRCVYPLPPQYQVPLDTKCETIHTEDLTDIVPPSEESQIAGAPVLSSMVQHNRENTENKASHVQNVDEPVEKITETPEKSENTTTTTNAVKAVSSLNAAKPRSNLSAKKPLSIKSTSTTPTKITSTAKKSTATTTTGTASRLTATKPALSKPKSATTTPVAKTIAPAAKTTAPVAKTTAPLPKTTAPGKLVQSSPSSAKLASEHKKPLTNVDVGVPPKQLLIKKSSSSTVASKLSTASTSSSTKTAPNKLSSFTAPKLSEKPTRLNSARQTTVNSTGSKPRATTIMPKSSSTMSAKTSTGRITTTTTKSATRPVTSNLKSTTTVAAPRPRSTVTTSRSSTKAADMEKQIKDASNKQLSAARTSNIKKTDNKAAVGVKLTSRTATSKSSTTSKKPTELCRTSITKTKITAANVPRNHSGTVNVIQDITTVSVVNTDEPQHTKDNSPMNITPAIDNSQLIDLPVPISD